MRRLSGSRAFWKLDTIRSGNKLETKVTTNNAAKAMYLELSAAASYREYGNGLVVTRKVFQYTVRRTKVKKILP